MTSQAAKDPKAILGTNLQRIRLSRGLTQRRLAALVNDVDPLAVSRWERGASMPSGPNLAALAMALGVTIADLYAEPEEIAA